MNLKTSEPYYFPSIEIWDIHKINLWDISSSGNFELLNFIQRSKFSLEGKYVVSHNHTTNSFRKQNTNLKENLDHWNNIFHVLSKPSEFSKRKTQTNTHLDINAQKRVFKNKFQEYISQNLFQTSEQRERARKPKQMINKKSFQPDFEILKRKLFHYPLRNITIGNYAKHTRGITVTQFRNYGTGSYVKDGELFKPITSFSNVQDEQYEKSRTFVTSFQCLQEIITILSRKVLVTHLTNKLDKNQQHIGFEKDLSQELKNKEILKLFKLLSDVLYIEDLYTTEWKMVFNFHERPFMIKESTLHLVNYKISKLDEFQDGAVGCKITVLENHQENNGKLLYIKSATKVPVNYKRSTMH